MKETTAMFEPVYRSRPGADAMRPAAAERAEQIAPGLWCSPGLSNSYLLTTADGRVVVNTGMGFEGPVHRANFDAVDCSPVRYIILTQGHVDHVGGLDSVRDPETKVVAQANWTLWRDDNERLIPYRASRSAFAFKDTLSAGIQAIQRRLGTTRLPARACPTSILISRTRSSWKSAADGWSWCRYRGEKRPTRWWSGCRRNEYVCAEIPLVRYSATSPTSSPCVATSTATRWLPSPRSSGCARCAPKFW
ncbi:alkyl sulfatase [Mycobacterium sp. 012931]|nr:alkyl sulfatase [Mycobacterium sp. 012931]